MVTSVDGKCTKGNHSPNLWASPEDQRHFEELKEKANLIVMGRKTYDSAKKFLQPRQGLLRIVMSHSGPSVRELVEDLEQRGYTEILQVGGGEVNAGFFKENLINEIYLTVEPKIFGMGLPLAHG